MKKYSFIILSGLFILVLASSCRKQLDLAPVSSVTDGNFWKTADQFDSFVAGVHTQFRSNNAAFQILGEMRADIFATDPGTNGAFTGEATQGLERLWTQNLNLDNPGVSSFGGFYNNINQLNLLISKLNSTAIVTAANKNYYLGIAYGMRAFYYYQLYRSWGAVIIQTEPTSGTTLDISNLAKAASPATDVMNLIKADIDKSVVSFGTDYSFKNLKSYWSKSATLMLKADVYLWTANRAGGSADATTAKAALTDIQTNVPALQLLPKYSDVFATTTKGNNEMIFVSHYQFNEATMAFVQSSFVPQSGLIANFYDSLANRQFSPTTDNWGGLLRAPVRIAAFRSFDDKDSRKLASIQPAYQKLANGTFKIAGCFADKYQGEQNAGSRLITNDYPIYRYADLLLMLAEAKAVLGESPATELNQVRARAFGANYNAAVHGFPNQTLDANPKEAVLQERFFEFVFEGKRWYDLRRAGDSYVYEHTTLLSSQAYALLWPVDRTTLTNNRLLVQTTGYSSF
ncbi:SusD family outer membrane lipoprotein NanU [Mucilaginibacter sp.]|uniref:SusD family outer membrane lipoprotein NanU n=1 Tax=Mucilaginibacter sp. TaxID=1882438 RepID=UPI0025D46D64|nr:SusD family outer membrane lipoprotein NanU [Mucilaginibacter sp.]